MVLRRLALGFGIALIGSSQGFVMPPTGAVAVRSSALSTESPVMLFGAKKPAPKKVAKRPVKKAVKKVVKKVVKKPVKKAVKKAKKVVKKTGGGNTAKTFAGQTTFGEGPLGTAKTFFSEENWVVQAITTLTKLPSSAPRQSDEGRG